MKIRKLQAVPSDSGTYVTGDAIGGKLTFDGAVYVGGEGGEIVSASIIDKGGTGVACDLYLFDADFTPVADNAPWAVTAADVTKFVGVIGFATYIAATGGATATKGELGIGYRCGPGNKLYGQLVSRGAPTYAAGALTVTLIAQTER